MIKNIINPFNKVKYSIFSKKGKNILKKYLIQFYGGNLNESENKFLDEYLNKLRMIYETKNKYILTFNNIDIFTFINSIRNYIIENYKINNKLNLLKPLEIKSIINNLKTESNEEIIISGPISLKYFKVTIDGVTKNIMLFGEQHRQYQKEREKYNYNLIGWKNRKKLGISNKQKEYDILNLFKYLLWKSDKCIDLFVEAPVFQKYNIKINDYFECVCGEPYKTENELKEHMKTCKIINNNNNNLMPKFSSPLASLKLNNQFFSCSLHHLLNCNFNNLRYHNFDLRLTLDSLNIVDIILASKHPLSKLLPSELKKNYWLKLIFINLV